MWLLPLLIVGTAVLLSVPLGRYLAKVIDGRYTPPAPLAWVEARLNTGPQTWKPYALAMLGFNVVVFLIGYAVLALQPYHPAFLNPDGKGMLSPSTIFNTACSFLTNTNLQHYSGEVHLSYGSQLFAIMYKQFVTPAIGLAALVAVIRGLRGDAHMGNFYLDLWRGTVYVLLPLAVIVALLLMAGGTPMTFQGNEAVTTVEGTPQAIARGPVAAVVAVKQLGTNGGGFFGPNSAHPFENPTAWTSFVECVCILLLPMAGLVMFGVMLANMRHAAVLYGLSLVCLGTFTVWAICHDTLKPNPAVAGHAAVAKPDGTPYKVPALEETAEGGFRAVEKELPATAIPPLPVDSDGVGNLEGKELRFGPSAGATWAAATTCTSNGSVNCMHDSLNPLAGLTPLTGMWLNCIFGGVGVGLINLLIYLIVAVFLAGLMVGRTPEYLGKKVEAREMKLAALALLAHPVLVLGPAALFCATGWGPGAQNNPGAHGFSEVVYEFTSAAANNGSGFEGLGDTYGFNDPAANPSTPAPFAPHWDIATGLVMMLARFIPIIAPLAFAGSLAAKKRAPFTAGTLRTDTVTFGLLLLGTIVLLGALMFLPAAALGPVAEHYGPIPFGG
jgi:potassium-transporting ATPase potassium-binding subunit